MRWLENRAVMRLLGYDYSLPGYYFVTICTKNMRMVFGIVEEGSMKLNSFGHAVKHCWLDVPNHYTCRLDTFVIMPNHVHGIIVIPDCRDYSVSSVPAGLNPLVREERRSDQQNTSPLVREESRSDKHGTNPLVREDSKKHHPLTEIVRGFKSFSAAAVNRLQNTQGSRLWMRSFHDHIIRTYDDVERAREYIRLNPEKWKQDSKNTQRTVY